MNGITKLLEKQLNSQAAQFSELVSSLIEHYDDLQKQHELRVQQLESQVQSLAQQLNRLTETLAE